MLPQMIQQQFQHMKRRIRKWQNFQQLLVRSKKNDNKYYYKNASGKTDKKTGWKKNQNGKYVYYVGSKGYVTEKISGGYWYHFSGKKFVKKSLSSYKNKTKTMREEDFFC